VRLLTERGVVIKSAVVFFSDRAVGYFGTGLARGTGITVGRGAISDR